MKGLNVTGYFIFFTFVCWRRIIHLKTSQKLRTQSSRSADENHCLHQPVAGNYQILCWSSCICSTNEVLDLDAKVEEEYDNSQKLRLLVNFILLLCQKSEKKTGELILIILILNPFLATVPISYPLKTPENLWFSLVFRGCKMGILARNGLSIRFEPQI